jgi:tetratricopeptide (TPR) repeat protein
MHLRKQIKCLMLGACLFLGSIYLSAPKPNARAQRYYELLSTQPSAGYVFDRFYDAWLDTASLPELERFLSTRLQETPTVAQHLLLSFFYERQGDDSKALQHYQNALVQAPDRADVLLLQAQAKVRLHQLDAAIADLHRIDGLDTTQDLHIKAGKLLARLYTRSLQHEKARATWQALLQAYIEALVKAGQLERAIELLKQLRQHNRRDRELLIQLAGLHDQNNDPNSAGQALDAYLAQTEKSEYAHKRIARLLERYQCKDRALALYGDLADSFAQSTTAQEVYAQALYRFDQKARALAIWDELTQNADLSVLLRLTQGLSTRGHQVQALQWLERRYQQFHQDIGYMKQLCNLALQCEAYNRASKWMSEQLNLAQSFAQLQSAVQQIVRLCQQSNGFSAWIERMERLTQPSVQQICLRAELLAQRDRFEQAHGILDTVQDAGQALALEQKIHLYRRQERWEEAAHCTQAWITHAGIRGAVHVRKLVDLYERAGRLDMALQWIPAWKRAAPGSSTVWLTQADILAKQGQPSEAIDTLRRAHALFDRDSAVLQQWAALCRKTERHLEAQRLYWRLYERAEDVSAKLRWVRDLAVTALALKQEIALIEAFQQRRRSHRSSVVPCLALAEIYRQLGHYEERRQALLEATRLRPRDLALLHEIARIEETEGDWQRALDTLRQAAALDRTSRTRHKMARLHIQYGNEQDGYRILFGLAEAEQIDARAAETMVNAMIGAQDWAMALDLLNRLVAKHAQDYRLRYLYAVVLEEEGRSSEATQQFLNLLDREWPASVTPIPAQPQTRASLTTVPEPVLKWIKIQESLSRAYAYRRARAKGLRYAYYGRAHPPAVDVPSTVDQCQDYALAHLLDLADGLPRSQRNDSLGRLTAQGIDDVEMISYLNPRYGNQRSEGVIELIEQYPEHETVCGLFAYYCISGQIRPDERARTAYEILAAKEALFAALLGLTYGCQDAQGTDILESSLVTILDQDTVDPYTFNAIAQILARAQTGLSKQCKTQLQAKLYDWRERSELSPRQKHAMFQTWLSLLMTDENKGPFVRALDQEIQHHRQNPGSSTQSNARQYRNPQDLIQPLPYPPLSMLDLPEPLPSLLVQRRTSFRRNTDTELRPSNLRPHLECVQDLLLRSVLAAIAREDAKAERSLQQYLQTHPNDPSAHVLLASVWARQDQKAEAVALLHDVVQTPWSQQRRVPLDAAMVSYGLELDPEKQRLAMDMTRQAAIRLCAQPLSQPQQKNLVKALRSLSLHDQANRLALRGAPVQQTQRQGQRATGVRSMSSMPQLAQIEDLLEKGKTDAALRLALHFLEMSLGPGMRPRMHQRREISELGARVQTDQLVDRLLTMAHPGQSNVVRRWLLYAQLCDLFERPEQTRRIYERILKKRPQDPNARVRMAYALLKNDPNQAVEHLLAVRRRDQAMMGEILIQSSDRRVRDLDQARDLLSLGKVVTAYLQGLDDPERVDLQWVDQLRERLSGHIGMGRQHLAPIYHARGLQEGLDEDAAQLQRQRRSVHNDLCRAMLHVPQLAGRGFSGLHAEARARGALTDEFADLAYGAWCLAHTNPPRWRTSTFSHSWGNGRENRAIHPIEYLLHHAWKKDTLAQCVRRLKEAVPSAKRPAVAEPIEAMAHLYLVPEMQFPDAAHTFVKQWKSAHQTMMQWPIHRRDARLTLVADVYAARSLQVDMRALIPSSSGPSPSGTTNSLIR